MNLFNIFVNFVFSKIHLLLYHYLFNTGNHANTCISKATKFNPNSRTSINRSENAICFQKKWVGTK